MTAIASVGTYLPPWGTADGRACGQDEDAVTLAISAGLAALRHSNEDVRSVVLVSRDLPLLEGGNSAALLAGLGLPNDIRVVEQIGGAPAVLDALTGAPAGTLVIGADVEPAAAAAVVVGLDGVGIVPAGRVVRSLPVRSRRADGSRRDYEDPRLESVRGAGVSLGLLGLDESADSIAGVTAKAAGRHLEPKAPTFTAPTASSGLFALAALETVGTGGLVVGVEQASATAVRVQGVPAVHRDERAPQPAPNLTLTPGPEIGISLAAYERAFEPKLRWEGGACDACGELAMPPRLRCLRCGSEAGWSARSLPRTGTVYTGVTIHVPVPGLKTPYSLAIVELDDVGLRVLVQVTGVAAGTTEIGDRGSLVFRRVAVRSGVPDYGFAFRPDVSDTASGGVRQAEGVRA